jgi:sigma-B regulation protein RsbU (phosphoserine phosphatase)
MRDEALTHSKAESKSTPLVFIVDDEPTAVRMIHEVLKRNGFRTATAGDVCGALKGIREARPDLILLDVNLADGSGFDVCRSIQGNAATSSIPILFISADSDTATKVRGFEAGGVDYITKPIAAAEVLARVRTHLRLKSAYERLSELQAARVQQLASAQQTLMPTPEGFPEAHFQVYLKQICAAGGDFYDVISAGEGIVDYLVADASGHDLAASYWTAALKVLAVEYASPVNLPLDVVRAINASLCRFLPSGAFFTLIYARLNHQTGRLSMISAGHPPAIIVRSDGSDPVIVGLEGDVVGAFSDALFGAVELILNPGDRLFLYSDGMIEAGRSAEQGTRQLADACHSMRALPLSELVFAAVEQMAVSGSIQDDTLFMGIER